jgi:hypothetical protein
MTAMSPVMSGNVCVGFLLRRFNAVEAYDRDAHALGIFESEEKAAAAVIAADGEKGAG